METTPDQNRALVGVIRYNQSYDPADPDLKTLSPNKWHDRVPWYLTVADNKVSGTCDSQENFDRDLEYAAEGGVSFFAHLNIHDNGSQSNSPINAVNYHMASCHRHKVKFCVILHFWLGQLKAESWDARVKLLFR